GEHGTDWSHKGVRRNSGEGRHFDSATARYRRIFADTGAPAEEYRDRRRAPDGQMVGRAARMGLPADTHCPLLFLGCANANGPIRIYKRGQEPREDLR